MTQPPSPQGGPTPDWQGQPQYAGQPQGGFPQQGGYPQPGFQQQPPPKKKGGCMKIGLIALGVLIVLGIIISATSGGGGDDSATVSPGSDNAQSAGEAPEDSAGGGVVFMGKTDKDTGAMAGETVTKKDIAITSTPLEAFPSNGFSEPQLCTTVTVQNNGDSQESFNTFDWSMQDPNGTSRSSSFMNSTSSPDLSSGEIAPGGQTSGAICFDGDPSTVPGEYVVFYTGNVFLSDRLGWVNQL